MFSPFLKQSVRSNYCGVYSTGMLLSLMGVPTDRRRALGLFGLARTNPDFNGGCHEEIAEVVRGHTPAARVRWRWWRHFGFDETVRWARSRGQLPERPTLMTFGALHPRVNALCVHVAVLVDAYASGILLLDPLGTAPKRRGFNVRILEATPDDATHLVEGSFYQVVRSMRSGVLVWDPN